jgi:hypothetical protein
MMKTHLKRLAKDHLTLCRIWCEKDWVLKDEASQQAASTVCKICLAVAATLARSAEA